MMEKLLKKLMRWNGLIISMMILVFLCNGCSYTKELKHDDPFLQLYNFRPAGSEKVVSVSDDGLKLSVSADGMPLSAFCRVVSDKTGVGIVYSDTISSKVVVGEFKSSSVTEVLNCVARELSVDCVKVGNTFFLGAVKAEDRGVLVRRVRGFSAADLKTSIESMISQVGKAQVFESGVIVVSDREHILQKISSMCDAIEAGAIGSWIVQLYFVDLRKDMLLEGGFDVKSSGSIAYNVSDSSVKADDLNFEGFMNLVSKSNYADLYATPMLILRDGVTGTWKDGERVPVPKKSVSQYGVVTTEGFDYIDTGLIINSVIRESSFGAILKLDITMSEIKGYVEYAPITSQCVFNSESEIQTSRLYLLGEMQRFKELDTQKQVLTFGSDRGKSSIQVWAQVYRISGPALKAPAKPAGNIATGRQSFF